MKIKALESFSGAFSMYKGEICDCENKEVIEDLFQAGYIEKVKPEKQERDVKSGESKRSSSKQHR
ncbi:hypothetical protein [Lachnoclostridium sp.]|uniref:hypothetical protein n=1 Tax=Lachnoclostridium sp. TaxID=2028282 RepID=UPI00289FCA7F|nr:hypothetical protein [Lachnoclostridium sp.]